MTKSNIFNIASKLFGVLFAMALLAVFSHLAVAAGIALAFTGAPVTGGTDGSGSVTTEKVKDGSSDLDMDYVSKLVTQMRPAATPLDTIMRQIRKTTMIKSFVSEYYAVDSRSLYDTVKTAYTKSGDGVTNYDLNVNNINMWAADDTVMFYGVTGSDGLDLVCFIISKNVTNSTIKIQPLNGDAGSGSTAGEIVLPSIPLNTRAVRLGSCKNELDAQTSPYAILPVKASNYMQIFMAQVEESTFQRIHAKEVEWNFSDYEAQNIYDMKAVMEQSFLFGYKAKFDDKVNAKERYSTGGVIRFITKALEYGTGGTDRTIDNATFVDWTQSIFAGNSGSDVRYLFGGNGLMANLMKVDTVVKQIEGKQTQVKWGLTFKEIETNFGLLRFYHHPLLDQAGWADRGIVLDLQFVEKHTFKPLSSRRLDLKASGQRNVDAVVIEETTGLILRYPDCHAIIKPKA